jgi:hypothetical protein
MTEKRALPVFNEVFGDLLRPASQPASEPEPSSTTGEKTHAKLKRNLDLALDVHKDALSFRLEGENSDKRFALEAANMTVKAALTTDRTALKARSEKTIERVLLRLLFIKFQGGDKLTAEDERMLRTAPRAEMEAALLPRQLAEYDRMEW